MFARAQHATTTKQMQQARVQRAEVDTATIVSILDALIEL